MRGLRGWLQLKRKMGPGAWGYDVSFLLLVKPPNVCGFEMKGLAG